jgi:hypothetical protein
VVGWFDQRGRRIDGDGKISVFWDFVLDHRKSQGNEQKPIKLPNNVLRQDYFGHIGGRQVGPDTTIVCETFLS